MIRPLLILVLLLAGLVAGGAVRAAIPGQDPDWPCQQRLVPQATAATFWNGELPQGVDWHADPKVAKLVGEIASRDVPVEEAKPKIDAFAKSVPAASRRKKLAEAFIGVVEQSNVERATIDDRIEELTRRQRGIASDIDKLSGEIDSVPADATGDAAAHRADATERKDFLTRTFLETQRTMRYACEVPADLDSRLGELARKMQNQ
jgi:hypothetical protein